MQNNTQLPKIVVICGPTGVGKTKWAIDLAKEFNGEIVGADSMQIYRYMDIGTAKPTLKEQQQVTHHMVDIVDPDDEYNAGRYSNEAREQINVLHGKGLLPVVAGGTGLYIKACLYGLFRRDSADKKVIDDLTKEAEENGPGGIYNRLKQCDPDTAEKINSNDVFRIVRALEVYETTGKSASDHRKEHNFSQKIYDPLKICLYDDRDLLYDRINYRVEEMMGAGFVDEVKSLLDKGYAASLKSMQSIGYRHVAAHLAGQTSWDDTIETMKRDTRRYAKRQLTWFKADQEIAWVSKSEGIDTARKLIDRFIGGKQE